MVDLTIEQEIKGIQNFLHNLYTQDSIAGKMRISICLSQLESGRVEDILMHPEHSPSILYYLTPSHLDYKYEVVQAHGKASFKHRHDLSMGHSASMSTRSWKYFKNSKSIHSNFFTSIAAEFTSKCPQWQTQ